MACSACFSDSGLRADAERNGERSDSPCPRCGEASGSKLDRGEMETLAHKYFVWGSMQRSDFGMAPSIQFNTHQATSVDFPVWLVRDVKLFEEILGVGFFHYGPNLWMIGEVEPLKALQNATTRTGTIERVLTEYPTVTITSGQTFFRVRVNPSAPRDPSQYDSPPEPSLGTGRLDSIDCPILYASADLELCLHECRVSSEDDLYSATLISNRALTLLDLSAFLDEPGNVTEFESLDMAIHMLFLAGKHSYEITRDLSKAAFSRGLDGIIFPSYFTYLRRGNMPFQTVYGMSHRRIPQFRAYEQSRPVQNLAIFGRPIRDGVLSVKSIDKVILRRVSYDYHFGPA